MLAKVGELESIAEMGSGCKKTRVKLTFKVGHECLSSAVESIDDHLAVSGTSDLDASVL